jgi:cation:H+ antiporter
LAGATSLPELLAGITSVRQSTPELSASGLFGSNMVNMLLLAVLDLAFWRVRVLRQVALKHVMTAGVAILITQIAVLLIIVQMDISIGWLGLDSLILIALYVVGVWIIRQNDSTGEAVPLSEEELAGIPKLVPAIIGFAVAAGVLVVVSPWMVSSAVGIAELTGISASFIGATLVSIATSLPEMVTTFAAVRIGAYDMAVGNLFGSNIFNMAALGLTDAFYIQGRYIGVIDPEIAITGMISLALMTLALLGNASRVRRRRMLVELDTAAIVIVYILGLYILYRQGLSI